jgi:hypothetical protein
MFSVAPAYQVFPLTIKEVPNHKPIFSPNLPASVTLQMTAEPGKGWAMKLPSPKDSDGDPVSISVNFGSASNFAYLSNDGVTLQIDDLCNQASGIIPGMFLINVVLDDTKEKVTFILALTITPPPKEM